MDRIRNRDNQEVEWVPSMPTTITRKKVFRDLYVRWMCNCMGSKINTEAINREIMRTWNKTLRKLLATIVKKV